VPSWLQQHGARRALVPKLVRQRVALRAQQPFARHHFFDFFFDFLFCGEFAVLLFPFFSLFYRRFFYALQEKNG
jgi:hypothetical protein